MNKFAPIALIATAITFAIPGIAVAEEAGSTQQVAAVAQEAAALELNAGKMLYGADGNRIASIYRVSADGNPQVILNGRLLTVPASSLSNANGKVTTSLTKREILGVR